MATRRAYLYRGNRASGNVIGPFSFLRLCLRLTGFVIEGEKGYRMLIVGERQTSLEKFFTPRRVAGLRRKGVWVKIK